MTIRYIVTVCDYNLPNGEFMKTVRCRQFRNLASARRYETKFYKKAMRKPGRQGQIHRWGSTVETFVNGANFSKILDWSCKREDFFPQKPPSVARTITITCKVS